MADFDLDDPLGDLLSDGSNDSFFENPKAKKPAAPKTPEKKSITDLFGLEKPEVKGDAKKVDSKKSEDWLGLGESIRQPPKVIERGSPSKSALKSSKKISFEDDDDILGNLGLDKRKEGKLERGDSQTKTEPSKKISLMDSILGPPKSEEKSVPSIPKKIEVPIPRSIPPKQEPSLGYGFSSLEGSREGRRSRQQTSGLMDPLGLFSNDNKVESRRTAEPPPSPAVKLDTKPTSSGDASAHPTEILFPVPKARELKTKSTPNIGDLPNWLGGEPTVKPHKSDTTVPTQQQHVETQQESKDDNVSVSQPPTRLSTPSVYNLLDNQVPNSYLTQQKFVNSQLEYQNASIVMQQQEAQIVMAMQLKKYDDNLADLQRKQQDMLTKQEQQFNSLLERQFAKQQIMENNLRMQQDRINNQIQMMLSQPPASAVRLQESSEAVQPVKKINDDEKDEQYESMISSIKQRSREEMFLLEESYKKQISTLEQSMDALENRLKTEIDSMGEAFKTKYEDLKVEYQKEVDRYKAKLEEMSALHIEEIKSIRENHNRVIDEIKYEYNTMLENIKQTKVSEAALFQNTSEYATKLETSLKILDVNTKVLNGVREKVENDYGVLTMAREESLKAKEEEIKLMRQTLEKARESAETERSQLLGLVASLETKISEQNQNGREERWALQQAASTLVTKTKALDREVEFTRASLERERDEMKTLKESLLAEQEKMILQLTEERLALSAERKRLETSMKLGQSYDSQKGKAELEAAIQVAREAAEMTDRERESLYRTQAELETLKRTLVDRERKISIRERELEARMQNAERRAVEGERAMEDAKMIERNFNSRMREIQGQLSSLTTREKKLAEEKIALSKERLALHNQIRQVKKCSLCTADPVPRIDDENSEVEQDLPREYAASDPDLLRLRMQYSDEHFNTNLEDHLRTHLNST